MPERFRRNGFSYRLPLLSAYAVALILSAMRNLLAVDNVSDIVIHIQVVIVSGFHLFPFRTEKLSPSAPMVLHTRGRVGSRRFFKKREDLVSEMLARSFCMLLPVRRGRVIEWRI